MSEQETSTIHVVDKRTKSKSSKAKTSGSNENPPSELEVENEPVADSQTESGSLPEENDTVEPDGDERGMPDPSFLLSMASMQMEAGALMQALIPIFDGYAWRSMGFLADPRTGETTKDMAASQLAIDTVQFFLSKVEAKLSETERRDMQRRLSDLRMNYIAKLREP